MTDSKACFRCRGPATTYVDFYPLDRRGSRFHTCNTCSDAIAAMPDAQRRQLFERILDGK